MSDQVNTKNQNITIKLKGNYQMFDQLCGLYESGELEKALGISILELEAFSLKKITTEQQEIVPEVKILDIAKVPPNTMTVQESAIATISPIIETIKNEVISSFDFWLDRLGSQGFKTAALGNSTSRKKAIQLNQHLIELIFTIDEINETEIRIYLKVRPQNGKGYLPENLIVSVFDDEGEFFPSKKTNHQTNILDLTIGLSFICKANDSFKISFTLNKITVVESFPE